MEKKEFGLKNPTISDAIKFFTQDDSGNSYEILVIQNGEICRVDFNTFYRDGRSPPYSEPRLMGTGPGTENQ